MMQDGLHSKLLDYLQNLTKSVAENKTTHTQYIKGLLRDIGLLIDTQQRITSSIVEQVNSLLRDAQERGETEAPVPEDLVVFLDLISAELGTQFESGTASRQIVEMGVCRLADNYECYLVDVIAGIHQTTPNILRSSDVVTVEFVLDFDNIDDLRAALVERKIMELGYGGFIELDKWCLDRLKIPLTEDETHKRTLIEIIETRNLIVHNRSKINARYQSKVKGSTFAIGDTRPVSFLYLWDAIYEICRSAFKFDETVAQKYPLIRQQLTIDEA
jgi:hypothetical protein